MCGLEWREAGAIVTLMNMRGLMELVILNVGLNLGVISVAVFSMMVIMALSIILRAMMPVLHWVYPASLALESDAEESKANLRDRGSPSCYQLPCLAARIRSYPIGPRIGAAAG